MSIKRLTKKQKKKIMMVTGIVLGSVLVLSAAAVTVLRAVTVFREKHEREEQAALSAKRRYIESKRPDINVELLTPNINSRPGIRLKKIKGIVVHYTANPGTGARDNRNYFESRKDQPDEYGNKVSSHFIIGLEGEIVQCIPLSEQAYASNERNSDTVSIECCIPDDTGKFNESTYKALISLAGWICAKYDITDRSEIIRHYDVTGKLCPKYYVEHNDEWKKLREAIYLRGRKIISRCPERGS